MTRVFAILVLIVCCVVVKSSPICSHPKYRLSGNVKPTFYSIKIHPDLEAEVFTGEVFIHIKAEQSVEFIEFHLNRDYLTIETIFFDSKKLFNNCHCSLPSDGYGYEFAESELIKIVRGGKKLIAPGAHIIYIKYEGKFSKTTEGLFKVGCSKNGTTLNYLLVTDFQPTYARRVFPCFDEPAFKARFQVNLVVPNPTHVALSNMKPMKIFETSAGTVYKFETTPPMSPYLVSFAITEPSYSEYEDDKYTPYRLYAFNASNYNDTRLLEFSSRVIRFYSDYTKFPYMLPKLDFIGFDRFDSSATENWGLVTFNTSLLSPENDVYDDYQKKAVIAHELAHFWFGNLVTNDWWDDIWLHESIATYMGLKAEEVILDNQATKYFPTIYMENLYWLERTKLTTPVVNFQEIPSEVRKNFNDITYNKGAAVLRMLEVVLKEKMHEVFVQFVAKFAFKTVTTSDFIDTVMSVTSDAGVREFMESYLYQNQFPVIFVDEDGDNWVLRQESYGFNPSLNRADFSARHRWTIPIWYITDCYNSTVTWFYKDQETLTIPKNNATWVKLNYQQMGFYRVRYCDSLWAALIEHDKELELYESNHLVLEASGLFEMDLLSCQTVLEYLWQLSNVTDHAHFKLEYTFPAYVKVSDIIKKYDKDAAHLLTRFFGNILERTNRHRLAKRFLASDTSQREGLVTSNGSSVPRSEQIEKCIQWVKNESHKYYSNNEDAEEITMELESPRYQR
ncbi:hypothetical protein Zmor_025865 [Zophobas morio]|uniref:Aminopeptidase n=1 Tax=Zophobas morio TaxID=2755281 RepID=A0AA38HUX2_9CUCU|nr:hypothetical protein Zmor_025865 [Zophobas morio]